MAIIMAPLIRVTARAAEGRVLKTVRARTPTARWTTAHAVRCTVLSSPVCAATGQPVAGSMNCGNSEKYSRSALGFRPLISLLAPGGSRR